MNDARPFGAIAKDIVDRMNVQDIYHDDTGRPLVVGEIVRIMTASNPGLNGYHAEIVGLDSLDETGQPRGSGAIWVRLLNMEGGMLTEALVSIHPARVRYVRSYP